MTPEDLIAMWTLGIMVGIVVVSILAGLVGYIGGRIGR